MDRSLDRHELTYALDRLTSDQRHVVTLRFLDGFTTAETAEIMGKTEDAVKKLQARGLVQLRRIIEKARRAEDDAAGGRASRAHPGNPSALRPRSSLTRPNTRGRATAPIARSQRCLPGRARPHGRALLLASAPRA